MKTPIDNVVVEYKGYTVGLVTELDLLLYAPRLIEYSKIYKMVMVASSQKIMALCIYNHP